MKKYNYLLKRFLGFRHDLARGGALPLLARGEEATVRQHSPCLPHSLAWKPSTIRRQLSIICRQISFVCWNCFYCGYNLSELVC